MQGWEQAEGSGELQIKPSAGQLGSCLLISLVNTLVQQKRFGKRWGLVLRSVGFVARCMEVLMLSRALDGFIHDYFM